MSVWSVKSAFSNSFFYESIRCKPKKKDKRNERTEKRKKRIADIDLEVI